MMSGRNVDFLMSNAAMWRSGSLWSSGHDIRDDHISLYLMCVVL